MLTTVLLGLLAGSVCLAEGTEPIQKLEVRVSLPPLAWLAEKIGGDRLVVGTLVESGQDPHTFSPTPKDILRFKDADLFIHAGSPFEEALAKKLAAMFADMDVQVLWDAPVAGHHEHGEHCDHGLHGHGDNANPADPHVWFSVRNLEMMAENLQRILTRMDPDGGNIYAANLQSLRQSLAQADAAFAKQLAPMNGKAFYVHHPAFGHFAENYGLIQKAVEMNGKDPSPRQLLAIIKSARADGVKTIVASPQFAERPSRILADRIGGTVVKVDPLSPDPVAAMRKLVEAIVGHHE